MNKKKIVKELEKFERRRGELTKIAENCKYLKVPNYISIPARSPACTHPTNKFKVCGYPDDCPILEAQEKGERGK